MEISPILLVKLLFGSVLFGVALSLANGAVRELFSVVENIIISRGFKFRREIAVLKGIYVFAADLALLIVCAVGIILLCYYFNYGEIRGFCILGVGVGYLLSHVSTERVFRLFIRALTRTFLRILFVACTPITFFIKICKKMFKKVKNYSISALEKKEKVLYNNNELLYIYKLSRKGFLNNGSKKD